MSKVSTTCIVGVTDGTTVHLGGDSVAANAGAWSKEVVAEPKVFYCGRDMVVGYCGSFRMGQLLRHRFHPSKQRATQSEMEYMSTTFVDGLRRLFRDGGFATQFHGAEAGGQFIVGYRGQLFEVEEDYAVIQFLTGEATIGCGYQWAQGSLFSTRQSDMSPEDRVVLALEAASTYSAYVSGPYHVVKLEPAPPKPKRKARR